MKCNMTIRLYVKLFYATLTANFHRNGKTKGQDKMVLKGMIK